MSSAAGLNQPPDGFTALFNGEDLSGWYGMGHFDPRKLRAMTEEERAAKRKTDMDATLEHWTVERRCDGQRRAAART